MSGWPIPQASTGGDAAAGEAVRLATFTAPATSSTSALLTQQIGSTSIVVHNLTLAGAYARGLVFNLASGSMSGSVTVSGPNPSGGTHQETLVLSGSGQFPTVKVYGPGAIVVTIPAQSGTTGRYTFGTWDLIGLPSTGIAKDVSGAGVGMQLAALFDGVPYAPEIPDTGRIYAPSIVGGYGAWLPSAVPLISWNGATTAVVSYIATA